jgi:hypothetical protein
VIPADHWHDNSDGTAWAVAEKLRDITGSFVPPDRPCDTCWAGNRPTSDFKWEPCPDCDGTGRHTFTVEVACGCRTPYGLHQPVANIIDCGGTGKVTHRVSVVPDMVLPIYEYGTPGMWAVKLAVAS